MIEGGRAAAGGKLCVGRVWTGLRWPATPTERRSLGRRRTYLAVATACGQGDRRRRGDLAQRCDAFGTTGSRPARWPTLSATRRAVHQVLGQYSAAGEGVRSAERPFLTTDTFARAEIYESTLYRTACGPRQSSTRREHRLLVRSRSPGERHGIRPFIPPPLPRLPRCQQGGGDADREGRLAGGSSWRSAPGVPDLPSRSS